MTERPDRGRRQFLLLAAFFLGPLALAFVIYYGFDWRPAGSTEHGELLRPVVKLPDVALGEERNGVTPTLRRKWSLIIITTEGCDAACQAVLYETRQVRTAMSRERDRIQRVLLIGVETDRATIELQHPDLLIVDTSSPSGRTLAAALGDIDSEFIYLADPLGNLMMRFPRDTGMKGIHTDLKKLLRLSRIG